jgi:PKHD-type hydroxylase
MVNEGMLANHWYWNRKLSVDFCEAVLNERKQLVEQEGLLITENKDLLKIRNSKVCWLPANHWLEGLLANHAAYANDATGWNFKLSRPESVQLAKYSVNEFYNWHIDVNFLSTRDSMRKISVVCLLNDPSEFEGGDFQFRISEEEIITIPLERGDILAFPSFVDHRVTPVTSGTRYSAVNWVNGPKTL